EVTARIAATGEPVLPSRQPAPRPAPAISPLWRTVPTAAMATNVRAGRGDLANARTPVPWIANPPVFVEPAASARASTVDDTDVHGVGAALNNAARTGEALDPIAQERAAANPRVDSTADSAAREEAEPRAAASPLPLRKPARNSSPLPSRKPSSAGSPLPS